MRSEKGFWKKISMRNDENEEGTQEKTSGNKYKDI